MLSIVDEEVNMRFKDFTRNKNLAELQEFFNVGYANVISLVEDNQQEDA